MSFSSEYLKAWIRNSKPYSLVVDANNNSVGLIRRSSVGTVRSLTDLEQFSPGWCSIHCVCITATQVSSQVVQMLGSLLVSNQINLSIFLYNHVTLYQRTVIALVKILV